MEEPPPPPPPKKVCWADITDDDPPDTVIDKHGIKVPYVPPHLRKIKKPPPKK
jgi:hypothetical protein